MGTRTRMKMKSVQWAVAWHVREEASGKYVIEFVQAENARMARVTTSSRLADAYPDAEINFCVAVKVPIQTVPA